jgi:hypothetical protein
MTAQLTLELSEAQHLRLREIAEHEQIPLATLVAHAAERILQEDVEIRRRVDEARAALRAGDWASHEDVAVRAAERRARLQTYDKGA